MRAVIIHVLCEGQTEQGFVEEVLKPYLIEQGVSSVKSVLVTTNKKKMPVEDWWPTSMHSMTCLS